MKYLYITLLSLLPFTATAVPLDRFINPIFYEEIDIPERINIKQTMFLTPSSISCYARNVPDNCNFWEDCVEYDSSKNLCPYGDCQLINQTEQRLLFNCIDEDAAGRIRPFYYLIEIIDKYQGQDIDWYEAVIYWSEEKITIDYAPSMFNPQQMCLRIFMPTGK